jgi:SAM-dependent methyltransferase
MHDGSQVEKHWNTVYAGKERSDYRIRDWGELAYIRREYLHPLISGNPTDGPLDFAIKNYFVGRPRVRALNLGCGVGSVEQAGFGYDVFQSSIGFDVSATAIEHARRIAQERGYGDRASYRMEDLTKAQLPESSFDAVFMSMALHHVLELEHILTCIKKWKTPQALLVLDEYVGPNRFQWEPLVLEHCQRLLQAMPERLRVHGVTGEVVREVWRPPLRAMIDGDPSEAVRSADIVPMVRAYFDVVELRNYGGTILHPLLVDIVHNFRPEYVDEDAQILQWLFSEEDRLIKNGSIRSNFAVLVVR